jgi:hypothetical protein
MATVFEASYEELKEKEAEIERLRAALSDFISVAQRTERHRQSVPFYGESTEAYYDLEELKDVTTRTLEQTKHDTP